MIVSKDNLEAAVAAMPRRARLDLCKPAEMKISKAIREIELLGASVELTDAITLLKQAREKVSDFIDHQLNTQP